MTRSIAAFWTVVIALAAVDTCRAQTTAPETAQPPTIERRWTGTGFVDAPATETAATDTAAPAVAPSAAATVPMVVNGTAVNVRSGPGMYYYELLKLEDKATVQTLGSSGGWTYIAPPQSVVPLIRKSDVAADASGKAGSVSAAMARVYARDPASPRTWAVIAQLPQSEAVTIEGQHGDYYIIATPAGARVCVRSQYLVEPQTVEPSRTDEGGSEGPLHIDTSKVEVRPIRIDPQAETLTSAQAMVKGELAKPLAERRWDEVEATLKEVAEKAEADYVKSAAAQSLAVIEFQKSLQEKAAKIDADNQKLQQQLEAIRREAEQRQAQRMGRTGDSPAVSYDFEGVLRRMTAVMAFAYRLEDAQGNYICLLNGNAATMEPLVGQTVRVWGIKGFRVDLDMNVCDVRRIELSPGPGQP
ncbi:MAG TPA: hypothetical protein PLP01_02845 [Phycisphaerae bacterium]|nr:hypothetical protein [Phycisphaerae bacterium]HOI54165.1 hypothetical protein [Phycisphaerae bacterium]